MSERSSIDDVWGELLGDDAGPPSPAGTGPTVAPPVVAAAPAVEVVVTREPAAAEDLFAVPPQDPDGDPDGDPDDSTEDGEAPSGLPAPPSFAAALDDFMDRTAADSGLLVVPPSEEGDEVREELEAPASPDVADASPPDDEHDDDDLADAADPSEPSVALPPPRTRPTGPHAVPQRSPDPRHRRISMRVVGVGAVVAIAAGLVWMMSSSPSPPPSSDAAAPAADAGSPAPKEAGAASSPPAASAPTSAPPSPPPADANAPPTAGPPDSAIATRYAAAAARFEASGEARDLADMAVAACQLDEGPDARAAFRMLKGPQLRKEVLIACRKTEVDVRDDAVDYTAPELVRRAERALAAGDAETAMDVARESNKLDRTSAAVVVMSRAACVLRDADRAQTLLRHVAAEDRPIVREACRALGITLP
jgi:hypothetical protein